MHGDELVALALLGAVLGLLLLAYRLRVPFPVMLVAGSALLGFAPGMPGLEVDPNVILVLALPPLLYSAAFFGDLRALQRDAASIGMLAIGLVIATVLVVGVLAHAALGLDWSVAFVLGAIVSPTDPVAAAAIAGRLGAPRRYVAIVEGESLVNDATALITYKFAVAAVLTGSFSLSHAAGDFLLTAAGGIAIGLITGQIVAVIRVRLDDPPTEITISLLTPYFAYLPAEAAGVSAVLAAVTAGIYLGRLAPVLITPATRIQAYAFWEIIVFVLNGALFVVVGLQLPGIIDGLGRDAGLRLVADGVLVGAIVIAVRFAWVYPWVYLPRLFLTRVRRRELQPVARTTFLVAFTGMRGAVSLAAALAVPRTLDSGAPFPDRDRVIFLVYVVILVTLLLEGLSLGPLIERLGLGGGSDARREGKARLRAAQAAIQRIEELADEEWVREDSARRMRALYEFRIRRFSARFDDDDDGDIERGSLAWQRLRRAALEAERRELLRLRNAGEISEQAMRRIERDLDLEDIRLEI